VTAAVVELLFEITPGQREALEGVTMLVATAVLFYVSYWLLSKVEVAKWSAFVKGRMEEALSTGSGFALASVAFLAVYREGFETILFYKALLTSAGSGGGGSAAGPVLAGIALGVVALVIVYVAISPLRDEGAAQAVFRGSRARCSTTWLSCSPGKGSPICRSPGSWGRRWSNGRHASRCSASTPPLQFSIASAPADRPAGRGRSCGSQRNRFNGAEQIVGGRRSP